MITTYNTAQGMMMWTLSPWWPPTIQPQGWWCGHCYHEYHLQYSSRDDNVDTVTMITTYNTAQGMMMWTLLPWWPPSIQLKGWCCGHCHHDDHLQYSPRDDDVDTVTMITIYNTAQWLKQPGKYMLRNMARKSPGPLEMFLTSVMTGVTRGFGRHWRKLRRTR